MPLKLSKYHYLFEKGGNYFFYAPLSNSFAELDKSVYEKLLSAQKDNGFLKTLDDEVCNQLRKMKVIDVDERLEINKIKSNRLLQRYNPHKLLLTINPTLACNFACPYCFESTHANLFMNDYVEDAILMFIQKYKSVTQLHVTWFGGEPLLAFDRIKSLSQRILNLGIKYSAGIITNGYLLTSEKINLLEELKIKSIQITIDGTEQTHNARRCRKDGGPTYQTILKNIDEAQKYSPQTAISIRVNIDRTNSNEFFDVLAYFRTKNYPNVSVYPGFINEIPSKEDRNHCVYDSDAMAAFLKTAYQEHGYCSHLFYPSNFTHTCAVRNLNAIVIGPLGELYKCWNDVGDFNRSYGYIDGRMTNEAVLYEYLVEADYLNSPQCNACKFFPVCDGGCPNRRIQNEKEDRQQDTCSLFKEHIEDFLMMHYTIKAQQ